MTYYDPDETRVKINALLDKRRIKEELWLELSAMIFEAERYRELCDALIVVKGALR